VKCEHARVEDEDDDSTFARGSLTTLRGGPRRPTLAEDRRTPDRAAARERELDAKVEELTRQIAELVNSAGVESRQNLREYAVDLLREETERDDAAPTTSSATNATTKFSPLAFAILIGLVSLPLLLLFTPLGLGLFAVAVLMGIWGLIDTFVVRR
jgi:hypothetical protein